nr:MAG TPA: hypothetical protein [Caudoviricetes sp.]
MKPTRRSISCSTNLTRAERTQSERRDNDYERRFISCFYRGITRGTST